MINLSSLLNMSNVSALVLFLGMFALCTLTISVSTASAGTPGDVIIRYKGDCDVTDMQFDDIEVNNAVGRANVVFQANKAVGKCSLRVNDDQKPDERLTVQSFACELRDADGNKYSAYSKATLNTGGRLDITCTAKIDTDTNDSKTDSGKDKGNQGKKPQDSNGFTDDTGTEKDNKGKNPN